MSKMKFLFFLLVPMYSAASNFSLPSRSYVQGRSFKYIITQTGTENYVATSVHTESANFESQSFESIVLQGQYFSQMDLQSLLLIELVTQFQDFLQMEVFRG